MLRNFPQNWSRTGTVFDAYDSFDHYFSKTLTRFGRQKRQDVT